MSAVSPKGRGINSLCLPRERDMFVLLLCATNHLPDEGSQGTTHKRADDEDPEVGEGRTTLKHCRSNRTGRVDRCACDGNQGDMDNHQREADSQAGEVACTLLLICRSQDDKHEDTRLDDGTTPIDDLDASEYSMFYWYDKLMMNIREM